MLECTLNKWEKLFQEMLEMMEFHLHREIDAEGRFCYSLEDGQHANLANIEEEIFYNAAPILDRLCAYENDYIICDIVDCLYEANVPYDGYEEWEDLLQYRQALPDNQFGFDLVDMICHHAQDIDIDKVFNDINTETIA